MDRFPRARTAIVSGATFGMGKAPGFDSIDLAAHAANKALQQVGLTPGDVDGLFVVLPDDYLAGLTFAQYLGIQPKLTDNNRTGGSSFLTHVEWASLALDAGMCDVALIAYGSNARTRTDKFGGALKLDPYEGPYKPRLPLAAYALAASRHMHEYGTTPEQLAAVAVAARQWAKLNPEAFAREDLSIEDVLAARRIADPFGVRDCCLVTDGAAAIVMTRADRARDLAERPAYVLGTGSATHSYAISSMPDLTVTPAKESGERAFSRAGVKPSDIDVLQLYDAFTINPILFLEDLQFCAKGEGGRFVEDGKLAPGGALPTNTNGGGLSCVHPGMYGLFTLVESTAQLMGEAGDRQVSGAKLALAHGNGLYLSSQATVILGTEETI